MQIYLVRHPRPAVAPGVCYGRSDLSLAEDAAAAARRLLAFLPDDLAATPLYASPLSRCRLLAEQLHAAPRIDARLQELDFGAWELRAWQQIERSALDAWAADPLGFVAPQGEAVAALWARVGGFLADLQQQNPPRAVLVTHAGVMKVCAAELLGLATDDWLALTFDFASVTLIEDGRLVWHNRPSSNPV